MKHLKLADRTLPALGLGTYGLTGLTARDLVEQAIALGYRHIDTAQMYGNEDMVGEAVRRTSIGRDALFITTKVWHDRLTRDAFVPSVEESLRCLQMDAVDLLLVHWPNPKVSTEEAVEGLLTAQDKGYARHIGVSNFPSAMFDQAVRFSGGRVVNNQVEYHPFLEQKEVLQAARRAGAFLTAYSPIAKGKVVGQPTLRIIGERHGKSEAQVALRWLLQQEAVAAIPRTSRPERLRSNLSVFDFELSETEMQTIDTLGAKDGRLIDPHFAPAWD